MRRKATGDRRKTEHTNTHNLEQYCTQLIIITEILRTSYALVSKEIRRHKNAPNSIAQHTAPFSTTLPLSYLTPHQPNEMKIAEITSGAMQHSAMLHSVTSTTEDRTWNEISTLFLTSLFLSPFFSFLLLSALLKRASININIVYPRYDTTSTYCTYVRTVCTAFYEGRRAETISFLYISLQSARETFRTEINFLGALCLISVITSRIKIENNEKQIKKTERKEIWIKSN